jgi:hypothetical protein
MLNEQNLVKVNCTIEQETSKAILIVVDDQKCWLPKSIITWDDVGDGHATISLPEWLAKKQRLI